MSAYGQLQDERLDVEAYDLCDYYWGENNGFSISVLERFHKSSQCIYFANP